MRARTYGAWVLVATVGVASCKSSPRAVSDQGPAKTPRATATAQPNEASDEASEERSTLTLASPAFAHQGEIPTRFTCEGQDVSVPLRWEGLPEGTQSLALIVDDPDAPDPEAPKMTWVHWVLYNIPPSATELPAAVLAEDLPAGTRPGTNSWDRTGYGGPCPPIGRHRYFHKLYALDTALEGLAQPDKDALEAAMKGHILAKAELIGTYQKQGE